jgi:serine/threonine-protein kinase
MIGRVLSIRYEVTAALYDGPIFTAYSAKDRLQNREVCIKVFKQPYAAEKEFVEACAEYACRAGSVQHPGVERVYELDDDEGVPYLVTEPVKGTSLRQRIRRFAPFSVPVSVSTAIAICEPLYALHKAGVVHGDVCAENIIPGADGSAVLLQAGIWEAYSRSQTAGMVALPGMAPYLAPEVSAGGMPTAESDIYAVGVLLFELLTAHTPYRAETPVALAMKHAAGPTPRVRSLNSSVPMVLDEIVNKALSKDPAQRYHTVGELLSDLRYLQDALRFGRSLSWPIRPETLGDPPPVAPKSAVLRVESKARPVAPDRTPVDDAPASDVPGWLRGTVFFAAALLVFFLGWWIMTSLNTAKEVVVPDIVGQSLGEARNVLAQSGLKMAEPPRYETSEKVLADQVMKVQPAPGEKVKQGGTVYVVVSSGSKYVEVPDLRDQTLDEVRNLLQQLHLQLNETVLQKRSKVVAKGNVVSQNPPPNSQVEQGTTVQVWVSSGDEAPERTAEAPSSVPHTYTVRITVTGTDEPVQLRVDMIDDNGEQTIVDEQHYPDDVVEKEVEGYGPQAIFKVYYNGVLLKQYTQKADDSAGSSNDTPKSTDDTPKSP